MTTQEWMWTADGAALALVLIAAVADWRRNARHDLDATGWVPWRGIQVFGVFLAAGITISALR